MPDLEPESEPEPEPQGELVTEPLKEIRMDEPGSSNPYCTCFYEDGTEFRGIIKEGKIYKLAE